jgi:LPS-assembly lipoprotein
MSTLPRWTMLKHGLLGLGLLASSACGFAPVYQTGGSGLGPIEIGPIDGRAGYFLRQELDRFAALEQGNSAPRVLTIKLRPSFASAALATDGISARTLYTLTASYALSPVGKGKPITGEVATTLGYESLDQAYADVALQADAEERAAGQIAEKIFMDLRRQTKGAR